MSNPSSTADTALEPPLTAREMGVVVGGLACIALAGWAYMFYMTWAMSNMDKVDMWMPPMGATTWTAEDFLMLFIMWATMMVAMMTPSILPMVLMFATLNRNRRNRGQLYTPTFVFITGYLVAWAGFSLLATFVQWPLHTSGLLNPMMNSRSYLSSGVVLMVAGVYQWTPYKDACLASCRSPLGFLMTEWRDGRAGALLMGIRHGIDCIGCCWALMLILFAVGVMNMLWVLLITGFVVIEKALPAPRALRLWSGLALLCWGGYWVSFFLVS